MLFVTNVTNFGHLHCYNIAHDIPDLVFKSIYLCNMNPAKLCLFKVNNLKKVSNMFTVNKIDTRTTLLTSF